MRNLKITLAYDGADFKGWQVQPDSRTVQGCLAEAMERLTGKYVLPQGSGRTDAGVHALAQVATCECDSPIPAANLVIALNNMLPPAIRVHQVEDVPPDFHARASAKTKTYRYRMYRGPICSPFLARYVTHHPWPLDENAMSEAARLVTGEHDFTSFAASDPDRSRRMEEAVNGDGPSNVRTIFCSQLERQGDELIYTVRGNGFLHHMVRNLIGTFLLVGKGSMAPGNIPGILSAQNRSANPGATAPASGLYLVSVEYL
jgi:tRNA pseudouridine38-40 synthase